MPPAIALIGAAASVAGGVAAVGGTMAGFAAAGLGTQLVAGALIAGGVMTGLGVVSGNKKLQKWGGVLSLAGGVAGLASGAWSASAGSIAEEAARESFRAAELGAQAAGEAAGAAGGLAGGLADATGALAQVNAGVSDIGIGAAGAGGVTAPPMTPGINPSAPAITAPSVPTSVNLGSQGGTMQTMVKGGGAAAGDGGMLSNTMNWMEKNPRVTQAGAGLLTAGLSGYAQQEAVKEQMRMQEEAQARARKRLSDSVQGVVVPVYQRKGP